MIGYIEGIVLHSNEKSVLIKIENGIGYEVRFSEILPIGKSIALYIFHQISENDQSLWGFKTLEEKEMFELLKTVNKVGASKAYPLVMTLGREQLLFSIREGREDILSKAPGIGKKMAEQIIVTLRDKVEKIAPPLFSQHSMSHEHPLEMEVLGVFQSLGYRDSEVKSIIAKTLQSLTGDVSADQVVKEVLREL